MSECRNAARLPRRNARSDHCSRSRLIARRRQAARWRCRTRRKAPPSPRHADGGESGVHDVSRNGERDAQRWPGRRKGRKPRRTEWPPIVRTVEAWSVLLARPDRIGPADDGGEWQWSEIPTVEG